MAQKLGGDHTQDLARILRLPGTLNRKDERNGKQAVVAIAKLDGRLLVTNGFSVNVTDGAGGPPGDGLSEVRARADDDDGGGRARHVRQI